ncbi:flavin reductase family protein [Actinocrispum sp. NPDC049592]|uniref:flavin reductase family protein n=1 Tax=Actinocrispum sp. NPDC049592 TaxID=3154835 RepID=UPI003429C230
MVANGQQLMMEDHAMPSPAAAPDFDSLAGQLDYPMLIVTTAVQGRKAGCLVGFASQCSIDPPLFMVWLSKKNHTYLVARSADLLGIHFPTQDNLELATLFGSTTGFSTDKFARCAWHQGIEGIPLLTDCPSRFTGRIIQRIDTGDHEGVLVRPASVGATLTSAQLGFQQVRDLTPGNEA